MKITVVSPTKALLSEYNNKELQLVRMALDWRDKQAEHTYKRVSKSKKIALDLGPEKFAEHLADLRKQINKSCLREEDGKLYIAKGLIQAVCHAVPNTVVENNLEYPETKNWPFAQEPPELRPYQREAVDKLKAAKHGAIEAGTGAGKSLILLYLLRELGLKAVVMAPSRSIAEQLFETFQKYLGAKKVGMFGDSKKQSSPDVVVGIAASLAKVGPDSKHYKELSERDVFLADESHQCPANTFEMVCEKLMHKAHYRFFVSGTQMRTDGKDLVLEGLLGDVVYKITVPQLVEMGFLSKPKFMAVRCSSVKDKYGNTKVFSDVTFAQRYNFINNPDVLSKAANVVNNGLKKGLQVLVLIDEIGQASPILNRVLHPKDRIGFAHAAASSHEKLPPEWKNSEPNELVKKFNNKEIDLLVGTSCIVTGTDIQTVNLIVYLMGGISEIQIKQSIGRGTRRPEGKTDFWFCDFDVEDCAHMHRHFLMRQKIYSSLNPDPVKMVGKGAE